MEIVMKRKKKINSKDLSRLQTELCGCVKNQKYLERKSKISGNK